MLQSLRDQVAGHVRGSLVLAAARPQWGAGLRAATAMMVPLALGWATDHPELIWSAFGGWLAMLADPGGPYPARAGAMATFAAAGAFITFAGSLVGHVPWLAIPALFVFALICSLVRVRGDTAAVIGVLALIIFCIAEASPASPAESLRRGGLFAAGSLFALVLSVAVWPFRPYEPVRQAVGACWAAIGELAAAGARLASSPADPSKWDDLVPLRRRVREMLEEARAALGVARAGRQGETGRGLHLLVLYEVAELLLGDLAALLEALRSRTEHGQPPPRGMGEALAQLARIHHAVAQSLADQSPLPDLPALPEAPADGDLATLFAGLAAGTRYAREAAHALQQGRAAPQKPGALPPPDEGPSLRDALAPRSLELQHALRVAIVATAAALLATALHIHRYYWVTITVIIILQPHSVATVQRALQRVGGTVIGGIVASLMSRMVHERVWLGVLLFAFACVGVAFRRINYALFAALVTPVFVVLAEINARGQHLIQERILDTLLGGALALAGALLLWPHKDLHRLPALIGAVLRADAEYLHRVLRGEGPAATVAARRRVGLATANAEAALQRLIGESPPANQVEPWMALIAYARRLSASITGLAATRVPPEQCALLEQALASLATAAESGAPPPELPELEGPDMPEPARRLARQLRVVHSALARLT